MVPILSGIDNKPKLKKKIVLMIHCMFDYCRAVNPSDCVDMDCDGFKKAMIKDNADGGGCLLLVELCYSEGNEL